MKAQIIRSYGEASVFENAEIDKPQLVSGHVLIKVKATSVNPADTSFRQYSSAMAPVLPAILHGDVAGVVEEVGPGVTRFKPGDEVYGCAGGVRGTGGALAEYMLADADLLAFKPRTLTMSEAAALPLVTITAWEGLYDRAKIRPGQTVLIQGGTGGVGHIGIQLAKLAGAKVFTTISSDEKAAIARRLGADVTINYRNQSVSDYVAEYTAGKGFDLVFDTVGGEVLDQSFEAAGVYGTVVSIMGWGSHKLDVVHAKSLSVHIVFMLIPMLQNRDRVKHGGLLAQAAELVDSGWLRPLLDNQTFTFEQVAEAHRRLESGQATGKVVLTQA